MAAFNPVINAWYSASFTVATPNDVQISLMISPHLSSSSSSSSLASDGILGARINAPAPAGPGFPRDAPSNSKTKGTFSSAFAFADVLSFLLVLLPLDFPLAVVVLFAGGDESGFIGSYSVVHPSSSSSNSSSFLSRYSVIEVCFVLFVCAFLFCVFVGIVGLTSAAMEEDDGFSTTFVFTHASASARAEKLLCCAFGNENTCFLHSSQVSYTPGFRPLATA
mmetsp:Transcript_7937/g.24949  ORF Transcript_7937/g.24949 Transcript_7937/m.24949 type:complete len:222 (-) Transcript_7937:125-790(-)